MLQFSDPYDETMYFLIYRALILMLSCQQGRASCLPPVLHGVNNFRLTQLSVKVKLSLHILAVFIIEGKASSGKFSCCVRLETENVQLHKKS